MRNFIIKIIFILFFLWPVLSYAEIGKATAIVTVPSLRVRENSVLKSKVLGTIKKGEKVKILNRSNETSIIDNSENYWFQIKSTAGLEGWVYGQYLCCFENYGYKYFKSENQYMSEISNEGNYHKIKTPVNYSFEYPDIWTFNGTVFNDIQGKKVAEILPGVISLDKNRNLLYSKIKNEEDEDESKIISKEEIKMPNYKCTRIVEQVLFSGGSPEWYGVWYPITYILENKGKAFQIIFYDMNKNLNNSKTFERVVSTIKFN